MKKPNKPVEEILRKKREKKRLSHTRKKNRNYYPNKTFLSFQEKINRTKTDRFLDKNGFRIIEKGSSIECKIPKSFSFRSNYKETLLALKEIYTKIYNEELVFRINFENCSELEITPLLLLRVILRDFLHYSNTLEVKYNNKRLSNKNLKVIKSNYNESNKILYSCRFIPNEGIVFKGLRPLNTTELIIGRKSSKKNFSYNAKGSTISKIINQIESCVGEFGIELKPNGKNKFGRLIGEILGNAEDHSKINEWYALGIVFINNENNFQKEIVLNLEILFLKVLKRLKSKICQLIKMLIVSIIKQKNSASLKNNFLHFIYFKRELADESILNRLQVMEQFRL